MMPNFLQTCSISIIETVSDDAPGAHASVMEPVLNGKGLVAATPCKVTYPPCRGAWRISKKKLMEYAMSHNSKRIEEK